MRDDAIFHDDGPELSAAERHKQVRLAHRAARDAQESLTLTAHKQYRRYRAGAGAAFLAWPDWHQEYLIAYGSYRTDFAPNEWGGMPPGGQLAGPGTP